MLVEHGTLYGELETGGGDKISENPLVVGEGEEQALDHAAMESGTD